jgi:type VI secretion system secreted protein Hcp
LRRGRLLILSVVASVFAALGVVAPAHAAVDYFLEVEGVPGESQDARFPNAIDLQSYSWGAVADKGKPRFQDLHINHRVDAASPLLFQRLATGTAIPSAELIARKAGETGFVFLRVCFQDVRVTSVQQGGSAGGADTPFEQVSFSYGALSEQYTQQSSTGAAGNTVFAGWNATQGALIQTYPASCGGS